MRRSVVLISDPIAELQHLARDMEAAGFEAVWLTDPTGPMAEHAVMQTANTHFQNEDWAEADDYYDDLQRGMTDVDARSVQRQAIAGLLWTKQFYYLDMPQWLDGDPAQPTPPPDRGEVRNGDWQHLTND